MRTATVHWDPKRLLLSGFLLALYVAMTLVGTSSAFAESCPVNCRTWFDGCNSCECNNGRLGSCTQMMCERQQAPRCVEPPTTVAPSATAPARTNEEGCAAYARAAVEQYDQLRGAGCDCWNGRWHNNYEAHRTWCLSLPNWNDSRPEFNARQAEISYCRGGRRPC